MAGAVADGIYFNTSSGLGDAFDFLSPDNQLKAAKLRQINAFRDGAPVDADGNLNVGALTKGLVQTGQFGEVPAFLQAGIAQQQQRDATNLMGPMSRYLSPDASAAPAASPTVPAPSDPAVGPRSDAMAPAGTPVASEGMTTITSPSGAKFQVASAYAPNFQGFVNDYEAAGGKIGPHSGGLSERPGNASYHPLGRAIDVDQVGRSVRDDNLTIAPEVEDQLAQKWGLRSGSSFSNPDVGHFEVNSAQAAAEALARNGGGKAPGVTLADAGSAPPAYGSAPYKPGSIGDLIDKTADSAGVPRQLAHALVQQESGGNPLAANGGLMQIKPTTASDPGFGMSGVDPASLRNPAANLKFGLQYFANRAKAAGVTDLSDPKQIATALQAYNGGGDPNYVANVTGRMAPQGAAPAPVQVAQNGASDVPMPGNAAAYARQAPGGASDAGPPLPPRRPAQFAQGGESDAPVSGIHPFGPTASQVASSAATQSMPSASPGMPAPGAVAASGSGVGSGAPTTAVPLVAPGQVAGPGAPSSAPPLSASATPRAAPVPKSFMAPPPVSPNSGQLTAPGDPSLGGQVPKAWLADGHSSGDWVRYARAMAAMGSMNPYLKGAAEQWSKVADGAAQTLDKQAAFTNEMKNFALAQRQGFTGTLLDFHNAMAAQTASGTAEGKLQVESDPRYIQNLGQQEQARASGKVQGEFSPDAVAARAASAAADAEAKEGGQDLGKLPQKLADAADSARQQNTMVDSMLDAARQFNMGKFADKEANFNATVAALGHAVGVDTSAIDGKLAGYQEYAKLAGQMSRLATKEVGGSRGINELKYIGNTLPSPTMSMDGFQAVANNLKGIGDFTAAKQQAAQAYGAPNGQGQGSLRGFDAMWNKNVTPAAFVMRRMQIDQPEIFKTTIQRLGQSAQGRATLDSIRSGMQWANSNGLFE